MNKAFLVWTFILLLTACNVAEQTPLPEKETQEANSTPSLGENKAYFSFDRPLYYAGHFWSESSSSNALRITRTGDDLSEKTVKVQLTQNSNQATITDITTVSVNGDTLTLYSGLPVDSHYYVYVPFPINERTVDLDIGMNNDADYELDEVLTFRLLLNEDSEYSIGSYQSATRTIVDDESSPDVYLQTTGSTGASATVLEGATASIDLVLTAPALFPVKVFLELSGTSESADHNFYTQSITIPAGQTTHQVDIVTNSDSYSEPTERATITILSSDGANLNAGRDLVYDLDITDTSSGSNEVSISGPLIVDEAGPTKYIDLSVTLNGVVDQNINVPLTLGGSAIEGIDYTITTKQVFFPKDGSSPAVATVRVSAIDDNVFEGAETIDVTVGSTLETIPGAPNTISITLTDDELSPVAQFEGTSYITQENETFYLPLSLNNAILEPITLDFNVDVGVTNPATPGSDSQLPASGTFTIPAGQTRILVPILIHQDAVFDNNETLRVVLSNPTCPTLAACAATGLGANDTIDILIKEEGEQLPKLSFTSTGQTGNEGSTLTITAEVDKISQLDQPFTVAVYHASANASDYSGLVTTQQINAGDTSTSFTVDLTDDTLDEYTEQFEIKLLQPNAMILGDISKHTVTIIDQDAAPIIDVAALVDPVLEGFSGTIQFSLAPGSSPVKNLNIAYTVTGTSSSGLDHNLSSGTVTLPLGQTTVNVPFDVFDDSLHEGAVSETIIVTTTSSNDFAIGTPSASIDITDAQAAATAAFTSNDVAFTADEDDYIDVNENDLVSISFTLSHALTSDIDLTFTVDDTYDSGNCDTLNLGNISCAQVVDYGSVPSVNYSSCSFTTGGSSSVTCQAPMGESYTRITFSDVPDSGSLDLVLAGGTYSISDTDITGATAEDVAQNLADHINDESNIEPSQEHYAHHPPGTAYVDIYSYDLNYDTDLTSILTGTSPSRELVVSIPAGKTSGKIEFKALKDDFYETTEYEAFSVTLSSSSDPTLVSIDPNKDSVEVRIRDLDTGP